MVFSLGSRECKVFIHSYSSSEESAIVRASRFPLAQDSEDFASVSGKAQDVPRLLVPTSSAAALRHSLDIPF